MSVRYWSCAAVFCFVAIGIAGDAQVPVASPSELRSQNLVASLTLRAAVNGDGRNAFVYNGKSIAPTIRISPGDTLKIDYVNDLPVHSKESCAISPCMDMTNLHFHGLAISPQAPQDNVIDMLAKPGETLHYVVEIPANHPPGLFWYHTHPHGESHRQALDGMSGAIVIDGIERYVPEVMNVRERVLVLRGRDLEHDPQAAALKRRVAIPTRPCGAGGETPERGFTVNGVVRPTLVMAPGERQFSRILNAAADPYTDPQIDRRPCEIVGLDVIRLSYPDHCMETNDMDHPL